MPILTSVYDPDVTYKAGDYVYYIGVDSTWTMRVASWVSVQNNNKGHTPIENPTWWELGASPLSQLDELIVAWCQRGYVFQAGRGINSQDVLFWTTMQEWLEASCVTFINHVSGPLNPAGTAFLYFTLETWRTVAGLNANGFRRAREWDGINEPVWLPEGIMQRGDFIGYWIIEDLQKAFSALRWTAQVMTSAMWWNSDNPWAVFETFEEAKVASDSYLFYTWWSQKSLSGFSTLHWEVPDYPGEFNWMPSGKRAMIYKVNTSLAKAIPTTVPLLSWDLYLTVKDPEVLSWPEWYEEQWLVSYQGRPNTQYGGRFWGSGWNYYGSAPPLPYDAERVYKINEGAWFGRIALGEMYHFISKQNDNVGHEPPWGGWPDDWWNVLPHRYELWSQSYDDKEVPSVEYDIFDHFSLTGAALTVNKGTMIISASGTDQDNHSLHIGGIAPTWPSSDPGHEGGMAIRGYKCEYVGFLNKWDYTSQN